MAFLKRNWSTLALIGIAAVWIGVGLGTNRCPSCVITEMARDAFSSSDATAVARQAVAKAPSWKAVDIAGEEISSADFKGKVSVVMYWATYCNGCKNEIPDLVAIRNEFPKDKVEIVALSVDDERKDLNTFAKERGINYRVARADASLEKVYGHIESIPTLIILDPKGQVQFKFSGHMAKDTLAERIRDLLPIDNA